MSIVAINWAMEQKTDGPSAQSVLWLIADRANEHGICRHADPDTIAQKTRQSRATVFRRLDELERVGVVTRLTRHLDDGRREYEVRLSLQRFVNYRVDKDRTIRLFALEDDDCATPIEVLAWDGSQIETQPVESQIETEPVSPVRLGESHSCDSQETLACPSKNPNPPNPPSGGGRVEPVDEDLEAAIKRFKERYPIPITNLPRLRALLGAMSKAERAEVLTALDGYAAFIAEQERKGKPRAVKDADRWVSGGHWEGFVVSGEKAHAAALRQVVPVDSEVGRAWANLHKIAGVTPLQGSGNYYLPRPLTPQELALAHAPPEPQWCFIGAEQANSVGAWNEMIGHALQGRARPEIVHNRNPGGKRGFSAPARYPPRKDGTWSTDDAHALSDQ